MSVVYFILAENGLYKIGTTKNLSSRFAMIQSLSPIPVALVLVLEPKYDAPLLEEYLHIRFKDRRSHSEWFRLDEADLEFVNRLNIKKHTPADLGLRRS